MLLIYSLQFVMSCELRNFKMLFESFLPILNTIQFLSSQSRLETVNDFLSTFIYTQEVLGIKCFMHEK